MIKHLKVETAKSSEDMMDVRSDDSVLYVSALCSILLYRGLDA